MSQLNAAKSYKNYFTNARTLYEKYINKKWSEKDDIFESKEKFIKRTRREWKSSSDESRNAFMSAAAPTNKKRISITNFFSTKNKTTEKSKERQTVMSNSSGKTENVNNNEKPLPVTKNASSAFTDRATFLNDKEFSLIINSMKQLGVTDPSGFFRRT